MSHRVRVATLATMVVLLFVGLAFGQVDGQPAGYVVGPAEAPTQEVETPEMAPPTSANPVAGIQGPEGPQGPRGPAGPDGKPGRDGRTIIREGHQGHGAVLHQLRGEDIPGPAGYGRNGWNVTSASYVDARDERTRQEAVREAKAYAEGLYAGQSQTRQDNPVSAPVSPPPAPAEYYRDEGGSNEGRSTGEDTNWVLLLLPLLILLAILSLIGYALWRWWRDRASIRNTASGSQFGRRLQPAQVISHNDGLHAISIQKGGANLSRNTTRRCWAQPGQKTEVPHTPGDLLEFVVSIANSRPQPMRTNGTLVVDKLVNARVVPGSGRVYAGNQLLGELPDNILDALVSGQGVDLATIVDQIPAAKDGLGRINIVYRVDTTPPGYQGGDQANVPPVGGGQAAPVGPLFTIAETPAPSTPDTPPTSAVPPQEGAITADPAAVAAEADRLIREGQEQ